MISSFSDDHSIFNFNFNYLNKFQNPEGIFSNPGSAGEGLSIAGQTVAGNFPLERFYDDDQHWIILSILF